MTDPEKLDEYVKEHTDTEDYERALREAKSPKEFRNTLIDYLIDKVGERPGFRKALEGDKMDEKFDALLDSTVSEYAEREVTEIEMAVKEGSPAALSWAEERMPEVEEKVSMASEEIASEYLERLSRAKEELERKKARKRRRPRRRRRPTRRRRRRRT